MTTEHSIELELDNPPRLLTTQVGIDWEYEKNPCDKERAHYSGEDDGYYRTDQPTFTAPILIDGKEVSEEELIKHQPEDWKLLEKYLDSISHDDL